MTQARGIDDAVTVRGDVGEIPEVSVFTPLRVEKTSFTDAVVGEGRAVSSEQQPLTLELALYSGETGDQIVATDFKGDLSSVATVDFWAQRIPGLDSVLECATVGSRIVAALSPEDASDAPALTGFGIGDDETIVFVIDVLQAFLPRAEGALQFNDARGLPTVVRAPDGTPGVIIPKGPEPEKQVVQTLIKGEGDVVKEDSTVWVNYTAVGWDDKQVLGSTWGDAPTSQLANEVPVVAEALVGKTVGSQVLVTLPGAETSPAVAVVVDILGITPDESE